MSNRSIRERISYQLRQFENGESTIQQLRDCLQLNGPALEMMPYDLVKEIDALEYDLTMANFNDEDGFETGADRVIQRLKNWLRNIPVES